MESIDVPDTVAASAEWDEALAAIKGVSPRVEIEIDETPAPSRLAPFALSLAVSSIDDDDNEIGTGKFIVLHDPAGQDAWKGNWRLVTFLRSAIEPEMAQDALLDDAIWSWLTDHLDQLRYSELSGTITRTMSKSFGVISDRPDQIELEVRAAWTPDASQVGDHLQVWTDFLAQCSGLPPIEPGVAQLPRRS